MHQAERDQAVDRLERIDRVAAGDRDAGLRAHRLAAFEDLADHAHRQLLERHADQRERHDRARAHRVDVGDRVGRGDAAEVVRVVDDRREEIGGGDQRLRVVQAVDRGVVRGLGADQKILGQKPAQRHRREHLGQDRRRDLAAAAAAVAELGEANLFGCVHKRRILSMNFKQFDSDHRRALARRIRRGPHPGRDFGAGARRRRARAGRHALQAGLAVRRQEARRGAGGEERRAATSRRCSRTRTKTWRPLVYCWRGGKRSGAMAHILREIGWRAETLEGGYKAYRRWVVQQLETPSRAARVPRDPRPHRQRQEPPARRARSAPARRCSTSRTSPRTAARCSATCPTAPQPSQKMFESLLLQTSCQSLDTAKPVFVEGESKKIGQLQVPEALMARMRASPCVVLETGLETRVDLLLDEYRHFLADRAALDSAARLPGRPARPRAHRRVEGARRARRLARVRRPPAGRALRPGLPALLAAQLRAARRGRRLPISGADDAAFSRAAQALLVVVLPTAVPAGS